MSKKKQTEEEELSEEEKALRTKQEQELIAEVDKLQIDINDLEKEISKEDKLHGLCGAIEEMLPHVLKEERIADTHFIVWGGNPEAKILILQLHPDRSELCFAKKENIHTGWVCKGPGGNEFRHLAKNAGFDPEYDFIYANVTPFYPLAGEKFEQWVVDKYIFILDVILEAIKPKLIITLGYDVLKAIEPDSQINIEGYEKFLTNWSLHELSNGYMVAFLANPEDIRDTEGGPKDNFSRILKILYVKTPHWRTSHAY